MKEEILESYPSQQFVSRTQGLQKSSLRYQEAQTQNSKLGTTGLHHNPNNLMQFQNLPEPVQHENCMQQRTENQMHHWQQQQSKHLQPNLSNSYQYPHGVPSNLSEVHQPQRMIQPETDALNMHQKGHQSHFFQQTRAADARQEFNHESGSLQGHVSPKQEKGSDPLRENSQQIAQNQFSFGQSGTFTEQPNKPLQENLSPGALSEPMELTGVSNKKDLNRHDEAYNKIQRARGMFLPYLRQLYSSFCARSLEMNVGHRDEQHKYKAHVEGMIKFLQVSRNDIEQYPPDWAMDRLQALVKFIKGIRMKRSESIQNHDQPGSQLQTPSAVQLRSLNHQERSENCPPAPAIASSFQISSQQGVPILPVDKPDPYQSGRGRQSTVQPIISSSSMSSSTALNSSTTTMTYTQPGSALISSQHLKQQHQHRPERRAGKQSLQQNLSVHSRLATLQHHHSETVQLKYLSQSLMPTNLHKSQAIPSNVPQKHPQKGVLERSTCHISEAGRIPHAVSSIPPSISSPTAPMHTEKRVLGASTFDIAENFRTPASAAHIHSEKQTQSHCPVNDASELENSILSEISTKGVNTPQHVEKEPIHFLTKLVKTIKPEALSASVRDIAAIISISDRFGSSGSDENRVNIGQDFAAEARCCLQVLDYISRCAANIGMKRQLDATSWEPNTIKRARLTKNGDLLEEIRNINRRLFETIVDVVMDSHQETIASEAGEGTLVGCSYSAVAAGRSLNTQHALGKMFPTPVLRLLVPPNYPNSSSSILLDGFSVDWRSEESEDFLEKVKEKFYRFVNKFPKKTSLEEMVKAWDACAREVFHEFANVSGGGCLSTKYGKWENCVTAS